MNTIDDRLLKTKFRPSGFDYLRLFLAVSVVAYHSFTIAYGDAKTQKMMANGITIIPKVFTLNFGVLVSLIVPCFFALSGFLVAGSLERNSLPGFLALRGLRIFPALAVEVLLCAFILGPLLTTLPLADYFRNPSFHAYLLNMVGDVHFELPGVFESMPPPHYVNAQLWTVPFELYCYIALAILSVIGLVKRPRAMILAVTFLAIAFTGYVITHPNNVTMTFGGPPFVFSFLVGVILYLLRQKIPLSGWLALASLCAGLVLLEHPKTAYFAPLPVGYLTVWLGLQNPRRSILTERADYSYGIYLYSYPVQQTLAFLLAAAHLWYGNLALGLLFSALVALLSWTFIESPALARKRQVVSFIDGFLSVDQRQTLWHKCRNPLLPRRTVDGG